MTMENVLVDLANFAYLPVGVGNSLFCVEENWKQSKGQGDDYSYEERTPDGDAVTKYHVWYPISPYSPFGTSARWKKFNPHGEIIASGKKS
ncbi:hypothetical protein O0882_12445 [Janthinobacterium sp. SUN073]|uniref:hypothetical protein n=1 Tax=Janthinobacterium sp. SUN073 TaxID=3004102 RepID=UPI0025AF44E7|nr:hypothetical protein [Janthinobacterium sp. SUN073]MDN2697126.1 hypothetical protein [Janthinobacterium sp. SUN073]